MPKVLPRSSKRFGETWAQRLVAVWAKTRLHGNWRDSSLEWLAALPKLCRALATKTKSAESRAARVLIANRWDFLLEENRSASRQTLPSLRQSSWAQLTLPTLSLLESAKVARVQALRDSMVEDLKSPQIDDLLLCLVRLLRSQAESKSAGIDPALREHAVRLVQERLARPERQPGDWSIQLPDSCDCKLCAELEAFLTSASEQCLEWPLAKEKRQHIHMRLDRHELPVSHVTRHSGRPYTLVLTKTKALFENPAKERRALKADLDWLAADRDR